MIIISILKQHNHPDIIYDIFSSSLLGLDYKPNHTGYLDSSFPQGWSVFGNSHTVFLITFHIRFLD